jgi:hypothetical protein
VATGRTVRGSRTDRRYLPTEPPEGLHPNLPRTDCPYGHHKSFAWALRTVRHFSSDRPKFAPKITRNTPLQHDSSGPSVTIVRTVRPGRTVRSCLANHLKTSCKQIQRLQPIERAKSQELHEHATNTAPHGLSARVRRTVRPARTEAETSNS